MRVEATIGVFKFIDRRRLSIPCLSSLLISSPCQLGNKSVHLLSLMWH